MYYFLFDYIWYRIARVYYKWDSDGFTASIFLGLSQGIFFGNIIYVATKATNSFDEFYRGSNSEFYKSVELYIIIGFIIINSFVYRKRYWVCRDRWLKEAKGFPYTLKGLLVVGLLAFPLVWFFFLVPHM